MKLTIGQVLSIVAVTSSLSATWGVTIYKVGQLEEKMETMNGTLQYILANYIQKGLGELPDKEWVLPKELRE